MFCACSGLTQCAAVNTQSAATNEPPQKWPSRGLELRTLIEAMNGYEFAGAASPPMMRGLIASRRVLFCRYCCASRITKGVPFSAAAVCG